MERTTNDLANLTHYENKEITELSLEGINVWGTNQQILEQQALNEIDQFAQQSSNQIEDGKITETNKKDESGPSSSSLDINSYIKRQEELRKIQEYKRTLHNSNKNKIIADKVVRFSQKKRKRVKKSPEIDISPEKKRKLRSNNAGSSEQGGCSSGSEYVPSESELDDVESSCVNVKPKKVQVECKYTDRVQDDGDVENYKERLKEYYEKLEVEDEDNDELEYHLINGGLKVPIKIWNALYRYQQKGVEWLWELNQKLTGGLLGDEMGLGKTVQIIAFLASIEYTKLSHQYASFKGLGPSVIVCPATVIHQWVKHFHDWAPEFRIVILHQSGSYQGNKTALIKDINKDKGIIVTSYLAILKYKEILLNYNWHYLILDEGHKIRNPNAKISSAIKQIRTPHRLMLTGSPMQNNLQELWSLFDFTNPGMLGNLATFLEHFNNPIVQGGFTNATPTQEATALSVASALKNIITPFLLRRSKDEVQKCISLPSKSEQVLFCSLTDEQKELYKGFLMSDHVNYILGKDAKNWFAENSTRANVLVAITALRKICNHPDIYLCDANEEPSQGSSSNEISESEKFGYYKKSGKMIVVSALLKIWKKQKHRVLLFTQSRAMITIFEHFLTQQEYKYLKMDGSTSVSSRQPLINKFNDDASFDVFLLTTRVGGLGVNLTGANRVIIYDPDWNPATDTQARERAWRIGQDKQVTIYRLLSVGTIEEKIYQRQVWKQLLSNKVLLDPKTHRFFKSSNLYDLFSLAEDTNPETANIFRDSRVKLQERLTEKKNKKPEEKSVQFTEDKIQAMKNLAQQIAKSLNDTKKETPERTLFAIELEEERKKKLKHKEELKKLTPVELMHLNKEKEKVQHIETDCNQVDDFATEVSFSSALEYSGINANLYNELKKEKIKNLKVDEKRKRKHNDKIIDESGVIDGEKVQGLVKTEVKKAARKPQSETNDKNEIQDRYVLAKLFSKKGVSGALQHDFVVENKRKTQSLRVQEEAKLKADQALEALRKSRLDSWRW